MIWRILIGFVAVLLLVAAAGFLVLDYGLFEKKTHLDIRANEEAYVIYYGCRGDKCQKFPWDEAAIDKIDKLKKWPITDTEITGVTTISRSQIDLLNSIPFCFWGDTTASDFIFIVTDRGETEGIGIVPINNSGYDKGETDYSGIYLQFQGTYRPCGWTGKGKLKRFLSNVFAGLG
jgi:hypothetical protein